MIVGIRKPDGTILLPPPSTATIDEGDFLIALGKAGTIQGLVSRA